MQEVMEHYGMALLAILEVTGAFVIVLEGIANGGVIYELVVNYMQSICG